MRNRNRPTRALKKTFLTEKEEECENFFKTTCYRDQYGRYIIRLPLSNSPNQLGQSREQVVSMFLRNEKQNQKNTISLAKYNDFMQEYLSPNHMRLVTKEDSSPSSKLPPSP